MKIDFTKINLKYIVAGLVLALLFTMYTCNRKDKHLTQAMLDNQKLDSMLNKYGQVITTQEAIVIRTNSEKEDLQRITDSLFNLTKAQQRQIKDVVAYYKGLTNTIIREIQVPYVDTVAMEQWSDSLRARCSKIIEYYEANSISVPRTAKDSTSNYKVDFTIRKDSLLVNSIEIPDSQYIRFVTLKGGILKKDASGKRHLFTKQSVQVQVMHTNPYIHVTGQNSVIYQPKQKPKILQKVLFIALGTLLGTKL